MKVAYIYLLKESLRFKKVIPWLLLSFAAMILATVWKRFDSNATQTDSYVNVVNILVFRLLPLASAIYTTMIVSQEVEQKTIVYLLTRPVQRWQLLIGRWGATVTAVTILSFIGIVAAFIGSRGAQVSIGMDLLAVLLGALAYGSLFLFITLIFNRALIICVLFAFGWESSVPNLPTGLQSLSVLAHMQAIAKHPEAEGGKKFLELIAGVLGDSKLTASSSAFGLLIFSIAMVGLSCYWFTTHEYIPREDAD